MRYPRVIARFPISHRLLLIVWPFLAIVALLVLLGVGSVDILSSVRAYVGGESLWSKAQKDATYYLNSYARTRSPDDYRRFTETIVVPLGDRVAREELEKTAPDFDAARHGFVVGRNHADDIAGMIRLFRGSRNVSYIDRAIAVWAEADRNIAELVAAAGELHRLIGVGADDAQLRPVLERIDEINARLTPLEDAFSYTLGQASRVAETVLVAVTLIAAIGLVLLGIVLSRRMLRESDAFESALQFSEERFALAVIGSNDGLWDWNVQTGEMYLSPRTKELAGYRRRRNREYARRVSRPAASGGPSGRRGCDPCSSSRRPCLRHGIPVPCQDWRVPVAACTRPVGAQCAGLGGAHGGLGHRHH